MGRGLGHLQHTILSYLRARNQPCWATELAQAVSAHSQQSGIDNKRSRNVTVQRALRSLEQRDMIRCGYVEPRFGQSSGQRLMCWLPEHPAPPTRPVLHTRDVETAVLAVLRRAPTIVDPLEHMAMRNVPRPSRNIPRPCDAVSYQWLVAQVKATLRTAADDNHQSVAINRAVKQLAGDWMVEVVRSRFGAAVWLRLAT